MFRLRAHVAAVCLWEETKHGMVFLTPGGGGGGGGGGGEAGESMVRQGCAN